MQSIAMSQQVRKLFRAPATGSLLNWRRTTSSMSTFKSGGIYRKMSMLPARADHHKAGPLKIYYSELGSPSAGHRGSQNSNGESTSTLGSMKAPLTILHCKPRIFEYQGAVVKLSILGATLLSGQYLFPLHKLRGPPCPLLLFGNLAEMYHQENNGLLADWKARYGTTYAYRGFFGGSRLMTTDLTAIAHILVRDNLASMGAGELVLTVEGNTHKRQRRILAPAFTAAHIKTLYPVSWDKANQLRDVWIQAVQEHGSQLIDVIGLAGFGYQFNALAGENDELANAYYVIFTTARQLALRTIFETWMPLLRLFQSQSQTWKPEFTVDGVASSLETSNSQHCLYALAQFPDSQRALREALRTIPINSPNLDDDVGKLKFLDWVVRETLRLHAPVTWTMRVATKDDQISVAKPFLDQSGESRDSIKIRKHDIITIPIQAINKKKDIWGEDAYSFRHVPSCSILFSLTAHRDRPERWQNPPEQVKEIQGPSFQRAYVPQWEPWMHWLQDQGILVLANPSMVVERTFKYSPPFYSVNSVIFSLRFFILIAAVSLTLPSCGVVARPVVKSEATSGNHMPLIVRPASKDDIDHVTARVSRLLDIPTIYFASEGWEKCLATYLYDLWLCNQYTEKGCTYLYEGVNGSKELRLGHDDRGDESTPAVELADMIHGTFCKPSELIVQSRTSQYPDFIMKREIRAQHKKQPAVR
ncbi:cytochrome P450 [Suillus lakei]|nr:cytochrome P450 [Suillus lakei]